MRSGAAFVAAAEFAARSQTDSQGAAAFARAEFVQAAFARAAFAGESARAEFEGEFVGLGPTVQPLPDRDSPHGPPDDFPGKSSFGIDQKQLTLQTVRHYSSGC